MLGPCADNCLLYQSKRTVTARRVSDIVDIDAANHDLSKEKVCPTLVRMAFSTIDITQTSNYNPPCQVGADWDRLPVRRVEACRGHIGSISFSRLCRHANSPRRSLSHSCTKGV